MQLALVSRRPFLEPYRVSRSNPGNSSG